MRPVINGIFLITLIGFVCGCRTSIKEKESESFPMIPLLEMEGQDMQFYLTHPEIDSISKRYAVGEFKLSDNEATFSILDSLTTQNKETRPFYYAIFTKVMQESDGALSEVVGSYGQKYAETFAKEFYENLDNEAYRSSYDNWVGFIGYEILMAIDPMKALDSFLSIQQQNCEECSDKMKADIEKFGASILEYLGENE